jgi:hypothetical protein
MSLSSNIQPIWRILFLSVLLSLCLSVFLFYTSAIHLYVFLFVFLCFCFSVFLPVCLFVFQSIRLFVKLSRNFQPIWQIHGHIFYPEVHEIEYVLSSGDQKMMLQWRRLNGITLGQIITDYINQMITITKHISYTNYAIKRYFGLVQYG